MYECVSPTKCMRLDRSGLSWGSEQIQGIKCLHFEHVYAPHFQPDLETQRSGLIHLHSIIEVDSPYSG